MRSGPLALAAFLAAAAPTVAPAQTVATPDQLHGFEVTIRRFDPDKGAGSGQDFVLPVNSPDEEHAIASTLANAASFSRKAENGRALPVAFMAVRVIRR